MKIGIVGMGWVGSSVAMSILVSGVATELLVSDVNRALAEGEALDLAHGASFYPAARVRAVALEDFATADAVVVAAGRGGRATESRLDLLRDNAAMVRSIARSLAGFRGVLLIVSNPVDLMTRVAVEASGLPPERVIGTGTMLDTARLRRVVGDRLRVDPRAIHAHVVGEHGDSEVVLWSAARAGGVPLRQWSEWHEELEGACAEQVRSAAYEIIARKGATNHAIGLVTANLLRSVLRDERRVLTVSRVQTGALGVRDVAISLPAIVGESGAATVLAPDMDGAEREAFERSVNVLVTAAGGLA
jgi:L-lactate dehydrogenase